VGIPYTIFSGDASWRGGRKKLRGEDEGAGLVDEIEEG